MGPPQAAVCYSSSAQTELSGDGGKKGEEGTVIQDSLKILGLVGVYTNAINWKGGLRSGSMV